MREVVLEIPARVDYLGLVRQVVAAAASLEPTLRDDRIDDLRIAVSEATTNAIEAHADASTSDRILIRCHLDAEHVEVQILDHGGGFDPGAVSPAPDAAATDRLEWERGLGIPLMQTLADETEIQTTEGGTAVRLVLYTARGRRALPGSPHAAVPPSVAPPSSLPMG